MQLYFKRNIKRMLIHLSLRTGRELPILFQIAFHRCFRSFFELTIRHPAANYICAIKYIMSSRKKRQLSKWLIRFIIMALLITTGYYGYQWWLYRRARFVRYPEFGISIPEEYPIHGIDVSKYQQLIAWDEVKAMQVKKIKLVFVFIKATEGIGNTDPQFKRNWKRSKDA